MMILHVEWLPFIGVPCSKPMYIPPDSPARRRDLNEGERKGLLPKGKQTVCRRVLIRKGGSHVSS